MRKIIFLFSVLFFSHFVFSQTAVKIIPEPVSVTVSGGSYQLGANIIVSGNVDHPDVKRIASMLENRLTAVAGISVSVQPGIDNAGIRLVLNKNANPVLGDEGYQLKISSTEGITISANKPSGIFYGMQTLWQLFPPAIESRSLVANENWTLPLVDITDYPRFGWRGLMLDVSRHFFTVAQVKQFIDDMVAYKYNLLHLHLTDDQGWRIEIKSYPKLTSVGAWRVDKTGTFGTFSKPGPNEPRTYGGFFTHDDIRELVKYAQERYVNILPEIDVPGHSLAAIASYPELVCTPGTYQVNSGEQFMVWPPNGHFYGLLDNALCPAKEIVYQFLDKVFTEVAELFPFGYIHMGGDETARNFWEKSPLIKELMKKEKLKNLDEVQSYFVKRVEKIINSKGKKMIGWDEILDGGLAPNAAVMSWRGMKGGIEAARMGHEVVMSPTTYAYIDYMQGDRILEPPVYATLRLNKAYEFEPVPDGVDAKYIKGGQANLWTEQVYNMRHAQYMTWPRGFAIAEALWSPKEKRNWKAFVPKVEEHFIRYQKAEKKYAPSMYDPDFKVSKNAKNEIVVEMKTEVDGLNIHYSFDNSFPDPFYPVYTQPLTVPKDASTLKVVTCRGKEQKGRLITFPIEELKRRAGIK